MLASALPTALANSRWIAAARFVPFVGTLLGILTEPLLLGACTYAVGRVFTQHFASGGTFLDFQPAAVREHFLREFEQAKRDLGDRLRSESAPA